MRRIVVRYFHGGARVIQKEQEVEENLLLGEADEAMKRLLAKLPRYAQLKYKDQKLLHHITNHSQ